MFQRWVNLVSGVPTVSNFSTTQGQGAPICIDSTSGLAYSLIDGVVTQVSGIPFVDNSVNWFKGLAVLAYDNITVGDITIDGTSTFGRWSGATGTGYVELDLKNNAGGANFGGGVTANNRIPIATYGTITGWEYDATPYVVNDPIMVLNTQTKIAGYTETKTTGLQIRICNLAAGFTVVLPTAVGNTARFTFVKALAAGVITIDGAGTETINGALTATLNAQYDKLSIVSDNANWWVV